MTTKENRVIGKTTTREMLRLSSFIFKQRLQSKARQYPNTRIILCDEHYTSKTCPQCGSLNKPRRDNRMYTCSPCNYSIDRDINAPRNILLLQLTKGVRPPC